MFAEAIEVILQDQCTPTAVRAIEAGGTTSAATATLWQTLENAGFLQLLAAEADGGAALALPELFPVLRSLGYHNMPLPVGQTMVAHALLPPCDVPTGRITLGTRATAGHHEATSRLTCPLTPCGLVADWVLARDGEGVLLLPIASAQRIATGVPRSLTATLVWPDDSTAIRFSEGGAALNAFAAALFAALLSGAMNHVFEMTLQYGNDRSQFGKSLGKFQAIQHQLSVMAEHTAAASIAAEAAFRTAPANPKSPPWLAAAVAKSRTSEAAVLVASTAHALHGAIGISEEYDLQLLTRRLHEWRMAHGSEAYWNPLIGQQVLDSQQTLVDFVRTA